MKNKKILLLVAVGIVAVGAVVFASGSGSLFQGSLRVSRLSRTPAVQTPAVQQNYAEVAQTPVVYEVPSVVVPVEQNVMNLPLDVTDSNPSVAPVGTATERLVPVDSQKSALPVNTDVFEPAINLMGPENNAVYDTKYSWFWDIGFSWKTVNMPETTQYEVLTQCRQISPAPADNDSMSVISANAWKHWPVNKDDFKDKGFPKPTNTGYLNLAYDNFMNKYLQNPTISESVQCDWKVQGTHDGIVVDSRQIRTFTIVNSAIPKILLVYPFNGANLFKYIQTNEFDAVSCAVYGAVNIANHPYCLYFMYNLDVDDRISLYHFVLKNSAGEVAFEHMVGGTVFHNNMFESVYPKSLPNGSYSWQVFGLDSKSKVLTQSDIYTFNLTSEKI